MCGQLCERSIAVQCRFQQTVCGQRCSVLGSNLSGPPIVSEYADVCGVQRVESGRGMVVVPAIELCAEDAESAAPELSVTAW